jgi:hypothetical protein
LSSRDSDRALYRCVPPLLPSLQHRFDLVVRIGIGET